MDYVQIACSSQYLMHCGKQRDSPDPETITMLVIGRRDGANHSILVLQRRVCRIVACLSVG